MSNHIIIDFPWTIYAIFGALLAALLSSRK